MKIPIKLIIEVLRPYVYNMVHSKVDLKDFPKRCFPVIYSNIQAIINRIDNLDEKNMKQLDSFTLRKLYRMLGKYMAVFNNESTFIQIMSSYINLCIKLLSTHTDTTRTAAIEALDKLTVTQNNNKLLAQILVKHSFVECVFRNLNEESIKSSESLLIFLINENAFTKEYI